MPSSGVQGWHPGETAIQTALGFAPSIASRYRNIENQMREQHRIFHTSNLPFIPLTVIDKKGRPWASIAAGKSGEIGFVDGPDLRTLRVRGRWWLGDPGVDAVKGGLTAGLGIEFSTRRRNKFAGFIRNLHVQDDGVTEKGVDYTLEIEVNEAVGNCPKYINVRQLDPYPHTTPQIAYQVHNMPPTSRLPDPIISIIKAADTVFIATLSQSTSTTSTTFPAHAGMNARGGLPGFIRVSPSDGHTIILPDYSGNRFMSSLGNIETNPVAGFTVIDFETGDVLYLTGSAKNLIGPAATAILTRHASITVLTVTGYTLVRNALPVRTRPGSKVGRSPYSPKVKYLVEETGGQSGAGSTHRAFLDSGVQLSDDLALFRFSVISNPNAPKLKIKPGQAIVLDFMDWLGPPAYQHMADSKPESVNDDRVRTWTVSSAHETSDVDVSWLELTMREMKGGAVTGALFDILRGQPEKGVGERVTLDRSVGADVVGVTGDFFLEENEINTLWVAGGIGVTPFLAMFAALAERGEVVTGDIVLVLATREPDVLLSLIGGFLKSIPRVRVRVDLFTRAEVNVDSAAFATDSKCIALHRGRIPPGYWLTVSPDREVLICGPNEFGDAAVEGLRAVGVSNEKIHREGFY
ncbi:hypothetical protein BJY04DRAFT_228157 [Aspergillus karnatakaensis]|uniref:uncharacterized protein n=1 Tax=Aspergillus karnatakaensis TaxID=1810916 RepID=UPI003CCCFF95